MHHVNHCKDTISDQNGNLRRAYRFEFRPAGGETVEMPLTSTRRITTNCTILRSRFLRSSSKRCRYIGEEWRAIHSVEPRKVIRFTERRRHCQGCYEPALFENEDGDSDLEVHHLHRLSDRGPDALDKVTRYFQLQVPSTSRADGDDFNSMLSERANSRTYENCS